MSWWERRRSTELRHTTKLPLCHKRWLTWLFDRIEQRVMMVKWCHLCGYSYVPSVHYKVNKNWFFLVALSSFCVRVGCGLPFTHSELVPRQNERLTSTSSCSETSSHMASHKVCSHQVLLGNPPPPPPKHQSINMNLPDKRSTLSMFCRQILSHPLAVSQPFDLSVCLHVSLQLNRMPSVLGKLQARRSGSRDLERIGKSQLNGRSCLCLTLPT